MLYLFSGLGADERIFSRLELPGVEKKYIPWIPPKEGESLRDYCHRLSFSIDLTQDFSVLGVSFGGIIAIEIAKLVDCRKVFVISSITSHRQMDWKMKLLRATKLYQLVPIPLFKWAALKAADYFFKTGTPKEKELRNSIIRDTDENFLRWAIPAFLNWKNDIVPQGLVHIHGTRDKIFPIAKIADCIPIGGGEHFMIVSRGEEIGKIILMQL